MPLGESGSEADAEYEVFVSYPTSDVKTCKIFVLNKINELTLIYELSLLFPHIREALKFAFDTRTQ